MITIAIWQKSDRAGSGIGGAIGRKASRSSLARKTPSSSSSL